MKAETYTFEKEGVKLQFSFEFGPKNTDQKKLFVELMKQALAALEKEIAETLKP